MALINNIYVLVTEESIDRKVETPSHPTESGLPLSDMVREEPVNVSLSGKIVDVVVKSSLKKTMKAKEIIDKIKAYQKEGVLITYVGQCGTLKNLLIKSFNASFNNKNFGGADFDISLREVRTAKKAYVKEKIKEEIKPVKETRKALKVGNMVKFLGGNVYVASDAVKASSYRKSSMCKLTKISTLANRKHIYHLISIDLNASNKVYGWVDADRVMYVAPAVRPLSNGGSQKLQIK